MAGGAAAAFGLGPVGIGGAALAGLALSKTKSPNLGRAGKDALQGGSLQQIGFSRMIKAETKGMDGPQKALIARLVKLRQQANKVMSGAKLKLSVALNPGAAKRALTELANGVKFMKNNAGANFAIFRRVADHNMKLIAQTVGIHSKAGKDAAAKNFAGISKNIQINLTNGSITARTALRSLRNSLVSNSKGGADVFATNLKKANRALDDLRATGKISKAQYDRERRALGLLADQQGLTAKGSRRIQSAMKLEAHALRVATGDLGANTRANKRVVTALGRVNAMTALVTGNTGSLAKVMQDLGGKLPTAQLKGVLQALNSIQVVAAALASVSTKKHRKGGLVRMAKGGLVPVALSAGELVKMPNGKGVTVPGKRVAADNVLTSLPAGSKVFTDHGQEMLKAGVPESKVLASQRPHFASGGTVAGAKRGIDYTLTLSNKVLRDAKGREAAEAGGPAGGTKGPKGLGTYAGLQMANWVIEALGHAQGKGVHPTPTSGYRSHAHNVAQGRNYFSEHEGTQYPHGAVDFGGFHSGLAEKMSVVRATADFKYPLLAPIGFVDDGHASGTGHYKGGVIGQAAGHAVPHFAKGGLLAGLNKRFPASSLSHPGFAMSERQVRAAAEKWGGLSPGRALQAAQISKGESAGYHPGIIGHDPGGTLGIGLWQITRGVQGPLGKSWIDKRGGDAGMRNPRLNAQVMDKLSGRGSSWGAWFGTKYLKPLQRGVKSVFGSGGPGSADTGGGAAAAKAKALTKKQRRHLKKLAKRTKGLHLSKGVEAKLKKLSGLGDVFGEYADRAQTVGGKVKGFDEAHWLQVELQTLFELRNTLIKAHNRAVKLRERATKLIGRVNKELGKLRKHPKANATMIGRLKKRVLPGLKKARSGLKTRDGELISSLTDVQGLGSSMKVMKRLPAVGELGGSIFTVQGRLKELSAPAEATDSTGTENTAAGDRASERADMLQQLLTESRLRTAVSEREFAILRNAPFAGAFATGGIAQGRTGQPMQAVVHGGEGIFTPEQMAAMGGGNFQIVVNGDITGTPRGKEAVEVYKDGRRFNAQVKNARLGGRAPLPGARG